MSGASKKMVIGSMVATAVVALAAVADIAVGFPFQKHMVMDILFLVSAAVVGYLCWDAYKDLS